MRTETKDLNYYLDLAYKIEITPEVDADGTGFNAEIPLLKGCMAFGETVEEAYEMLMEVKQAWFDIALKRCWKIPEPYQEKFSANPANHNFNVRLPSYLHDELTELADCF
jgi:predicted RNase H-like HicB family nuclease